MDQHQCGISPKPLSLYERAGRAMEKLVANTAWEIARQTYSAHEKRESLALTLRCVFAPSLDRVSERFGHLAFDRDRRKTRLMARQYPNVVL
jgi:hypothetical protein